VTLAIVGLHGFVSAASHGPNDSELAGVVAGKDTAQDVIRKLGRTACLMPNATGGTVSYLYNIQSQQGPYYLQIEINGHVDAMTISQDPPFGGVCYAPVLPALSANTKKGVALGASPADIIQLYGEPTERFSVGPIARYRYVAMYDRPFEWDFVFRNGSLVEWTIVTEE